MPGTVKVDVRATFQTILLMSIAPKLKFGTDVPEVSATGEAKYVAELAVTYLPDSPTGKPLSEVISATLTGGDRNAILSIPPGSLVEVEGLRCGVSTPEQRLDGRGVRGGRLWWQISAIRPIGQRPGDKAA